jgi:hypothetical protein
MRTEAAVPVLDADGGGLVGEELARQADSAAAKETAMRIRMLHVTQT